MAMLGPKPQGKPGKGKRPQFNLMWMYMLIILSLVILYQFQDNTGRKELPIDEFYAQVSDNCVTSVKINRDDATAVGVLNARGIEKNKIKDTNGKAVEGEIVSQAVSADEFMKKIDAINAARASKGQAAVACEVVNGSDFMKVIWYFGPILIFVLFMVFMARRMNNPGGSGGIFSVGKSRAKVFDKNSGPDVTFKDVAGLAEAKVEIEEIVEFLKNPQRYTELGAKIPRGALLVGPPGTGKTLLAKAVAGEANVPFLSISGSDFVEMFVGVGAARVRDLFKQAKEKAPCIVFIDEIDAVGRARGKNPSMGSNDERENTLNQMLTEMDGFDSNNGVIILAATNRVDMLDKALLRPGRFDRQITVDLPELTDRVEIMNVHLRNIKVNSTLDVEQIARMTAGFSGADLANVCNEAALIAARNHQKDVGMDDFRKAIDRIVAGLESKSVVYTKEEKFAIATHEAGHATVSWLIQYGKPLVKVTIVPHGNKGGYAMYSGEERSYQPIQSLLDDICTNLGGRAAEEIFTGVVGIGAFSDLEHATKVALTLVTYYGASPKLANLNYYDSSGQAYGFQKPYSEATAKIIDEEVARIIAEQYERAKEILRKYAKEHNEIRDLLISREVIYHDDVQAILGPRPWKRREDDPDVKARQQQLLAAGKNFTLKKDKDSADKGSDQNSESQDSGKDSEDRSAEAGDSSNSGEARPDAEKSDAPAGKPDSDPYDDEDDPGTPPPFKNKQK